LATQGIRGAQPHRHRPAIPRRIMRAQHGQDVGEALQGPATVELESRISHPPPPRLATARKSRPSRLATAFRLTPPRISAATRRGTHTPTIWSWRAVVSASATSPPTRRARSSSASSSRTRRTGNSA
jgi:hypothetical protein